MKLKNLVILSPIGPTSLLYEIYGSETCREMAESSIEYFFARYYRALDQLTISRLSTERKKYYYKILVKFKTVVLTEIYLATEGCMSYNEITRAIERCQIANKDRYLNFKKSLQ